MPDNRFLAPKHQTPRSATTRKTNCCHVHARQSALRRHIAVAVDRAVHMANHMTAALSHTDNPQAGTHSTSPHPHTPASAATLMLVLLQAQPQTKRPARTPNHIASLCRIACCAVQLRSPLHRQKRGRGRCRSNRHTRRNGLCRPAFHACNCAPICCL